MNEVTWKLTNGELTDIPASHGQWGGYRTTKPVALVICLGPRKWLARYGNMVCGPLSLPKAKAAAMAMARGAAGDYDLRNPIAHLNGLTARLMDLEADWCPEVEDGINEKRDGVKMKERHRFNSSGAANRSGGSRGT